jgi:hypothetical protein
MCVSKRVCVVALVFSSTFFLSVSATGQQSDQAVAERVLGSHWKQVSRRAGMIFAGTVLAPAMQNAPVERSLATAKFARISFATSSVATSAGVSSIQLSFRVDEAIAGVEAKQVITIHEWAGARSMHRPMRVGEHVLIFLYPPSRLGLTSPIGGSSGMIALDPSGNVSIAPESTSGVTPQSGSSQRESARRPRTASDQRAVSGTQISLIQLERAIRSAREE